MVFGTKARNRYARAKLDPPRANTQNLLFLASSLQRVDIVLLLLPICYSIFARHLIVSSI